MQVVDAEIEGCCAVGPQIIRDLRAAAKGIRHGNATSKANGVTFEAGVPAEHEPTMTLTQRRRGSGGSARGVIWLT